MTQQRVTIKAVNEMCVFLGQVAWVTRSGKTELAEPIAVRPTSETGLTMLFILKPSEIFAARLRFCPLV